MMHRNVFSLITVRLALATLLLTACVTETFGQLDERWSVTINGQTVRVEADGSFLLSNVAAPDLFGPGGPGTGPDFLSDDVFRLTGVRTTGSGTLYVYSPNAVRILADDKFTFPLGSFKITAFAPPLPESLALQVGCNPSVPTECGPVFAVGKRRSLTATATLTDGTQNDVTLPSVWTTYRTSNVNIARIVGDNADLDDATTIDIEGVSPGVAFITATNTGATSVVKIIVANPANLISTTVEGFVRNADASSVSGATVIVRMDDEDRTELISGLSSATGFFSISPVVLLDTTPIPSIFAEATVVTSITESGSSAVATPIAGGITDVGIITIDTVCDTPWSMAFSPTTFAGLDILTMAIFDDDAAGPNPPALFVGGSFSSASGTPVNNIAKWNGQRWVPLVDSTSGVDGVNAPVFDLAVIDLNDGLGPALYAVGIFQVAGGTSANRVAKWNGRDWSGFGIGIDGTPYAVAGFDDGSGNGIQLHVGGDFIEVGDGTPALRLAKWNPMAGSWSQVGPGINNGRVFDLTVFDDDGPGPNAPMLYMGGDFFVSSSPNILSIAKWVGTSISSVGYEGLRGASGRKVTTLTVFDDGSGAGTALYAGGTFDNPRNFGSPDPVTVVLNNMARWDGNEWSALGNSVDGEVLALAGLDDGVNPPILYASGFIRGFREDVGSTVVKFIAQWSGSTWLGEPTWDGTGWSEVGTGIEDTGTAMIVFDDGNGKALYVGGDACMGCSGFARNVSGSTKSPGQDDSLSLSPGETNSTNSSAAIIVGFVAKWKNSEWSVLGDGLNDEVHALVVHDDGAGSALFAGGMFTPPPGPQESNESKFPSGAVAKFDGEQWSSLGIGVDCVGFGCVASVNALVVFDEDGAGSNPPRLFAGGDFALADGITAVNMARWDGTDWSAVGTVGGFVEALAVFDDDGAGPNSSALYAGGVFSGGVKMWDGAAWTTLGGGVSGSVFAEAVFNDELYIGGSFSDAGGAGGPGFLARWDGSTWSAVGSGVNGSVYALTVFDDGTGSALYVGGEFLAAGGSTVNRVAKWNGSVWSAMDSGLGSSPGTARVDTLAAFDNGQGERLYAGGDFTTAGGVTVNRIAKWTGGTWLPVGVSSQMGSDPGGGVDGIGTVAVQALAVFDDGTNGPALFTGGAFETAAGSPSSNIAKLGCR